MSIESFFENHPADSYFANEVSWPGKENKSRIKFMADILIDEGRKGLIEFNPTFIEAYKKNDQEVIEKTRPTFVRNTSAVSLGVGLKTIEEILKDGYFDNNAFNTKMWSAYLGTGLTPKKIETQDHDILSKDEMRIITTVAMADKTFAFFFKYGFRVLPNSMQSFYQGQLLNGIQDFILNEYEIRTKLLIEIKGTKHR